MHYKKTVKFIDTGAMVVYHSSHDKDSRAPLHNAYHAGAVLFLGVSYGKRVEKTYVA